MGQSFEDLVVWQKAMDFAAQVYEVCRQEELSKDWR
jgi:hypothetical protein